MPLIPATFKRSCAQNTEEEAGVKRFYGLQDFNAVGSLRERPINQFKCARVIAEDNQRFGGVN